MNKHAWNTSVAPWQLTRPSRTAAIEILDDRFGALDRRVRVGYRRTKPGDEWRLDNLHRPFKPAWLLCVARRPLDRVA